MFFTEAQRKWNWHVPVSLLSLKRGEQKGVGLNIFELNVIPQKSPPETTMIAPDADIYVHLDTQLRMPFASSICRQYFSHRLLLRKTCRFKAPGISESCNHSCEQPSQSDEISLSVEESGRTSKMPTFIYLATSSRC